MKVSYLKIRWFRWAFIHLRTHPHAHIPAYRLTQIHGHEHMSFCQGCHVRGGGLWVEEILRQLGPAVASLGEAHTYQVPSRCGDGVGRGWWIGGSVSEPALIFGSNLLV